MPTFDFDLTPDVINYVGAADGALLSTVTDLPHPVAFTLSFYGTSLSDNGNTLDLLAQSTSYFFSTFTSTTTLGGVSTFRYTSTSVFSTSWTVSLELTGGNWFDNLSLNLATAETYFSYRTTGGLTFTANSYAPVSAKVVSFTLSGFGGDGQILSLSTDAIRCFCDGTRLAVPGGTAEVQTLREGDPVLTADGQPTTVRWVGVRQVTPALHDPRAIAPVRIPQGALGDGLPQRDLRLSADHAIEIDDVLVTAAALVDGITIRRDRPAEPFAYYHIETEGGHELLRAEGVAAESYLEQRDSTEFDNADDRLSRVVSELPMPRVASPRLLPARIRARLGRPEREAA